MAMPTETALEYLVTAAAWERARALRNASLPSTLPANEIPSASLFLQEAVAALKRDRDVVMELLMR